MHISRFLTLATGLLELWFFCHGGSQIAIIEKHMRDNHYFNTKILKELDLVDNDEFEKEFPEIKTIADLADENKNKNDEYLLVLHKTALKNVSNLHIRFSQLIYFSGALVKIIIGIILDTSGFWAARTVCHISVFLGLIAILLAGPQDYFLNFFGYPVFYGGNVGIIFIYIMGAPMFPKNQAKYIAMQKYMFLFETLVYFYYRKFLNEEPGYDEPSVMEKYIDYSVKNSGQVINNDNETLSHMTILENTISDNNQYNISSFEKEKKIFWLIILLVQPLLWFRTLFFLPRRTINLEFGLDRIPIGWITRHDRMKGEEEEEKEGGRSKRDSVVKKIFGYWWGVIFFIFETKFILRRKNSLEKQDTKPSHQSIRNRKSTSPKPRIRPRHRNKTRPLQQLSHLHQLQIIISQRRPNRCFID